MKKAFTFVELLIVFSTIAILAAIAVPNFLEAQTRSKVARQVTDMAAMKAGVQAYYSDYLVYPPNQKDLQNFLQVSLAKGVPTIGPSGYMSQAQLQEAFSAEVNSTPEGSQITWFKREPEYGTRPLDEIFTLGWSGVVAEVPVFALSRFTLKSITTPVAYVSDHYAFDVFSDVRGWGVIYLNYSDLDFENATQPREHIHERYVLISCGPDVDGARTYNSNLAHPVYGPFLNYDPTNGTISPGDIIVDGN